MSNAAHNFEKIDYEKPNNDPLQTHCFPTKPLSKKHFSCTNAAEINDKNFDQIATNFAGNILNASVNITGGIFNEADHELQRQGFSFGKTTQFQKSPAGSVSSNDSF